MEVTHENTLRSCRSNVKSFIKVLNCTSSDICLEWIDFRGKRVCYCERLQPASHISLLTYVGHPWVVSVARFKHPLRFGDNKDKVYFPTASDLSGEVPTQTIVKVFTPMKSLTMCCLHTMHKLLPNVDSITNLRLPKNLGRQLINLFENQNGNSVILMQNGG